MPWLLALFSSLFGAQAQTFTELGQVMGPDVGISFASLSVGGPSITWDSIHNQLIMVFEARTPTTASDCNKGVWALGMATSTDGTNWNIESTSVVMPTPSTGNGYACVAAHPSAVFTNTGSNGRVQVYWKAESNTDCSGSFCEYTGIGRARIDLDASGGLGSVTIQAGTVIAFPSGRYGGYPRIVRVGSTFHMAVQLYPNVHTFTSNNPTTFTAGVLAFDPTNSDFSSSSWVYDEFMSPAMICGDDSTFEYAMWLGSKDTDFGVTQQGGIGKSISTDFSTWFTNSTASITWAGDNNYRHFDAIKLDTDEYLLYYSVKDSGGDSTVHLAATDAAFDLSTDTPIGKVCP
ncbi:MAG: hypothetical protein AAGA48_18655 [Myxococcota bacterium]